MDQGIVINRLCRWARWKMESGVELGYKRKVNYMHLIGSTSTPPDCGYDLECQQTNQAVEQLPVVPMEVIRMEYLSTAGNEVAKAYRMGISVRTYRNYKNNAYSLLSNILSVGLTYGAEKSYKAVTL